MTDTSTGSMDDQQGTDAAMTAAPSSDTPSLVANSGAGAVVGGIIGAVVAGPPGAVGGAVAGAALGAAVGEAANVGGTDDVSTGASAGQPGSDSDIVPSVAAGTGIPVGGLIGAMGAESLYGATTTGGMAGSAGMPAAAGAIAAGMLGSTVTAENEQGDTEATGDQSDDTALKPLS